ncbi:MAG TPA: DUF6056 family protein [Anaerolineales bacterium]
MGKRDQYLFSLLALLPPSIVLFLHGYLGSYTRPLADDFCTLYYGERFGLLRSIWFWRLTWGGRYSAFAADWFASRILGAYNLHLFPPILLVIWLAFIITAIAVAFRIAFPEKGMLLGAVLLGAIFLYVVFTLSPAIPQSFYWWNGMRVAVPPLIVLTCYAILFQVWPRRPESKPWLWLGNVLSFSLCFLSSGFSETFAVVQFFLLIFLIGLRFFTTHQKRPDADSMLLLAGWLGTILSLVVIISAPGNAIRQAQLPPSPNLADLLIISLQGCVQFLVGIALAPEKITALIGAILIAARLGGQMKVEYHLRSWQIAAYAVGGILLSFVCFPPGVFGYSAPPPPRTLIIPAYFLTACILYSSFLAGIQWREKVNPGIARYGLAGLAVALLGFSALIQSQALYRDRERYIGFAHIWDKLDRQILDARAAGAESITIPAVENWAGLNVLNDNRKFWVNDCYTRYYGIQVFGATPEPIQP